MSNNSSFNVKEKSDEEKRKHMNELRAKENDRQRQVEERKRLILEAEHERKQAILRRNEEIEAKLDAKRTAARNTTFVFGSSTPRQIHLEHMTALGPLPYRHHFHPHQQQPHSTSMQEAQSCPDRYNLLESHTITNNNNYPSSSQNEKIEPGGYHTLTSSAFTASMLPKSSSKSTANMNESGNDENTRRRPHSMIYTTENTDNSKERYEDKVRHIREKQEQERLRRLQELEMSNNNSFKVKEKSEEEKRKQINEMKAKEIDRQRQVEERKRMIWEAERGRKEAILRRNNEIDAKLDAKRNAARNSTCFVFGSSTPRSINLDNVTTLGPLPYRQHQQPSMLPSTPTPAVVYESNDDNMVRRRPHSMIYTTENTVESLLNYEHTPHQKTQAINSALRSEQAKACLTMSSIPEVNHHLNNGYIHRLDDEDDGKNLMTQSLVLLPSPGRRRHPELTPVIPKDRDFLSPIRRELNASTNSSINKLSTGPKRAISMTRLDQLAKPRQRYLEETLRARNAGNYPSTIHNNNSNNNCMVRSMYNLTTRPPSSGPRSAIKKATSKDGHLSRPISSLSGTSDASTPSSSVIMRPRTARKPRPVSIGACAGSRQTTAEHVNVTPAPVRESRATEKKPITPASQRGDRARSAGSSSNPRLPLSSGTSDTPKPPPPRKPAHVKAAAAARKSVKKQLETNDVENELDDKEKKSDTIDLNGKHDELPNEVNNEQQQAQIMMIKDGADNIEESSIISDAMKNDDDNLVNISAVNNDNNNTNANSNDNNNVNNIVNNSNENSIEMNSDENQMSIDENQGNKKSMSVEEYRRVLAEKRKQAREQAEREAEQERQRLERIRLEEEERERQLEEESRRLAEEHRQAEEEKLRKAIEEQQQREEEERQRREEALRQKQEKEEQEAKAKEEAERARIELEERLRRDEEERLLRKKRVEAIMTRTRKGKETSPTSEDSRSPDLNSNLNVNDSPSKKATGNDETNGDDDIRNLNETNNSMSMLNGKHDNVNVIKPKDEQEVGDLLGEFDAPLTAISNNNSTSNQETTTNNSSSSSPIKIQQQNEDDQLINFDSNQNNNIRNTSEDDVNSNRVNLSNPFTSYDNQMSEQLKNQVLQNWA